MHRPGRICRTPLAGGPEVGLILVKAARPVILVPTVEPVARLLADAGVLAAMSGSELVQLPRGH